MEEEHEAALGERLVYYSVSHLLAYGVGFGVCKLQVNQKTLIQNQMLKWHGSGVEGQEGCVLELSWFNFVVTDDVAAGPTGLVAASLGGCAWSARAFLTSCSTAQGNHCMPALRQPLAFKCRFDKLVR